MDPKPTVELLLSSKTIVLQFSNYAKVELRCRGSKASRQYEFEYWGNDYHWKRVAEKAGMNTYYSYHLQKGDSIQSAAHIVCNMLSPSQIRNEEHAGGWVLPCSMWISDQSILEGFTDIAEVVVATGLAALVDDTIKRKFGPNGPFQLILPQVH
ncbi:hypothetical protein D0Z07_1096 [Hyphodiscus hymeniophilus]|uniref:Uncharacterized protein n=1 Tax=Hyphodiscus hymeniophilus TaxID=353542 RepID=A0A9P6VRA0_9HELO|nr:hypothetical protein D0Z07_1096 [Hyphodiscus hymeniophilus]